MEFDAIYAMLLGVAPWLTLALQILGGVVIVGIGVDKMIPDEKDGGFMTKVLSVPVLGSFLSWTKKFSPFNTKE